jgi:acetoin utilization deacetylase AcuC-like enzyme
MKPGLLVVKDQRFARHLEGVFHLESPKRMLAFETIMQHPPLADKWAEVLPRPATTREIAWVHSAEYIRQVEQTSGKGLSSFDIDTQATARSYETALLAVGGVFSLLDKIQNGEAKRGFAFVRPPGHHAEREKAMGFCIFNNVALGARYLQERYGLERIMIVDIDAHHGNGIQTAFYDSHEVLYVSMHQFPGFPGTGKLGETGIGKGEGFTVNIPLGKGHGDRDFARIVRHLVYPLAVEYRPEILLIPCGFDLYLHDRLGGMRCTPSGYALITRLLIETAENTCNGRIVFIAEGGYSMKGIRECGLRVMEELCDVSTLNRKTPDKIKTVNPAKISILKKVFEVQKKYWRILR